MARSAWPTCGQHLLLAEHDARRSSRRGRPAAAAARARPAPRPAPAATVAVAGVQAAHVAAPARRRFPSPRGTRCGAADQRLRDRLGEPLRLHQRLAAGADLRRAAVGRQQRQHRRAGSGRPGRADQHAAGCAAARRPAGCRSAAGRCRRRGAGSPSCRRVSAKSAHLGRRGLGDDRRVCAAAVGCMRRRVEARSAAASARPAPRRQARAVRPPAACRRTAGVVLDASAAVGLLTPTLDLVQEAHVDLSRLSCLAAASTMLSRRSSGTLRRPPARPGSAPARAAPAASRKRAPAKAGRGAASSSRSARQLVLAAQAGQPVDQQRAVDVERRVEADQPRLLARRGSWRLRGRGSRPGRPRRAGGRAGWPRRGTSGGCAAPAAIGASGEDLAGLAQRKQEAAASCTRPPATTGRAPACAPPAGARPAGSAVRAGLACWPFERARSVVSRTRGSSATARRRRPA